MRIGTFDHSKIRPPLIIHAAAYSRSRLFCYGIMLPSSKADVARSCKPRVGSKGRFGEGETQRGSLSKRRNKLQVEPLVCRRVHQEKFRDHLCGAWTLHEHV